MDRAKLFFRENPYPAAPSPERFLAIGSVDAARRRLIDMIDRRDGIGMIVGPTGTGKSLLCSLIASTFRNRFDVVLLSEARLCTRRALLQHLLHHLGLPFADRPEGELRLALIDRAASGGPDSREGLLIIVDEAQGLPARLLEELRMMAGIVRNGAPRVQLVLAGGPLLDERLSHPKMEAFSQRIGARCYLHPLGCQETGRYIRESIRRAGADPATAIDDDAIHAVYFASSGIPRLINQTMSRAVAMAESEGIGLINGEIIERAWADLQQLPSPIVEPVRDSDSRREAGAEPSATWEPGGVIEFGGLSDGSPDEWTRTADMDAEMDAEESLFNDAPLVGPAPSKEPEPRPVDPVEQSSTLDVVGLFGDGFDEEQWITSEEPARGVVASSALGIFASDSLEIDLPLTFQRCEATSDDISASGLSTEDAVVAGADRGIEGDYIKELALHAEVISINNEAMGSTDTHALAEVEHVPSVADAIVFPGNPGHADITVRDDRDLLVIEEDVELDASAALLARRPPRACGGKSSEMAFQEILSRLREG